MYLHAIQQQQQQMPKKQKQQNSKRRNSKMANNERQRKIVDYLRNLCADVSPLGYFRFMMIMFCALPPPFAPSIPVASSLLLLLLLLLLFASLTLPCWATFYFRLFLTSGLLLCHVVVSSPLSPVTFVVIVVVVSIVAKPCYIGTRV